MFAPWTLILALLLGWNQGLVGLQYNIYLYAGTGYAGTTGSNGAATSAGLNIPRAIWQDTQFSSYVAEASSYCIRKISSNTIISDFAGVCGASGSTGNGGAATDATFSNVYSIFIDSGSKMYVADNSANLIRQISSGSSIISAYAGSGGFTTTGNGGKATSAGIGAPRGLWANSVGVLYIVEFTGLVVRSVSSSSIISAFAGKLMTSRTSF